MKNFVKKSAGNVFDFLTACLTVITIAVIVSAGFNAMGLLTAKLEISQIARRYILVMETKGCLEETQRSQMYAELQEAGLHGINIEGTTLQPVGYGETIMLCIRGNIEGFILSDDWWSDGFKGEIYEVEEKRMSTAKH